MFYAYVTIISTLYQKVFVRFSLRTIFSDLTAELARCRWFFNIVGDGFNFLGHDGGRHIKYYDVLLFLP